MARVETVQKDIVKRMLAASKALCRVIVLVVNMQIVVTYGIHNLLAQEEVINEGLCCLAGKLHHHTRRSISVHVRILTGNVVRLDVDDLLEDVTCLCLARDTALVTVGDVLLGHILAATLHEFHLHHILNGLDGHLCITTERDVVTYLAYERHILTLIGVEHSLTDSRNNLFFIKADNTSVALYNCLNHIYY